MNAVVPALLAETRRRPGRILLTGLAVLVATVFTTATLLLGGTLRAALLADVVSTPQNVDLVLRPSGLDEDAETRLLDQVRAASGVTAVTEVRNMVITVHRPAGAEGWMLGSDPMTGPLSRLGPVVTGRLPGAAGEVVVGVATAERAGLHPGSLLTVEAVPGAVPRTVTVTGTVSLPHDTSGTMAALPRTVATLGGAIEQIDVVGAAPERLVAVAPGVEVRSGDDQRTEDAAGALSLLSAVLTGVSVFTLLALVAAAVVVASTFRIVLTQRRTQTALLRCVGATRRQIVAALLVEAAVSGLVAGVLGAAIALVAGHAAVAVWDVGTPLVVSWPGVVGCVLLAVVTTVVSALVPALAAGRIPPVAALGAAAATDSGVPRRSRRGGVAALLLSLAVGLAVPALQPDSDDELALLLAAGSGLAVFAAIVALGPLLVTALAATVGRVVARVGGPAGRLAVANAAHVPRRTAATITVLALGVGLTSALLVGVSSADTSSQRKLAQHFRSAVSITPVDEQALATIEARLATDPALRVRSANGQVLVDPAPGTPDAALRAVIGRALGDTGAYVTYGADLQAAEQAQLGNARDIGLGLVGMTLLVALVGIGVTLTLSVAERIRETGLLRAVGLTRPGVRAMVAWEAGLAAAAAALLGTVLGIGYGLLAAHAVGLDDGVGAAEVVPFAQLGLLVVATVVVAVVAAAAPAARAGRVTPIRAIVDA